MIAASELSVQLNPSRSYTVAGSQHLPSIVEFILQYSGLLPPRGSGKNRLARKKLAQAKHALRRAFHQQLKHLWHTHPVLSPMTNDVVEIYSGGHIVDVAVLDYASWHYHRGNDYRFVPLVTRKWALACRLHIDLLCRPEPGALAHGGDIDNRMKTLLDALRVPSIEQMQDVEGEAPDDERPFFALLEDDSLVLHTDTRSHRLLKPPQDVTDERSVDLIIRVEVVKLQNTEANAGFELP